MNASFGDFFSLTDRQDYARRNITLGSVIYCHSNLVDKDKRIVIIGISGDKKKVATLRFNSDKYFTKNLDLSKLELHFDPKGREYLDHESYLSCLKIEIIPYQLIFDRLVANPEDLKGIMNKKDLDWACTTAVNVDTAVTRDINEFGLLGYILKAKP